MGSRSKTSVAQASAECRQKKLESFEASLSLDSGQVSVERSLRVESGTWLAEAMAVQGHQLMLLLLLGGAAIGATQKVNTTEIRLESGSGLKNYEEEEEGTVLPYRTFLTTVEIIIICVVTVIVFVLTVLLI